MRGGTDDSYGIEVAALAGVPKEVIVRAKKILKKVENDELQSAFKGTKKENTEDTQIGFTDGEAKALVMELSDMDATTFTPIEAMNMLYKITIRAKEIMK